MRNVVMSRTTKVLELVPKLNSPNYVSFSREPDDPTDNPATISISRDDFEDLGLPEKITVTVEPGDRLNDGTD